MFPLLQLPPEIWARIGKFVIDSEANITQFPPANLPDHEKKRRLQQPGITRTCKTLREELLAYFYQCRIVLTLTNSTKTFPHADFGRWLRAIGRSNRENLQAVMLTKEVARCTVSSCFTRIWGVDFVLDSRGSPSTARLHGEDWAKRMYRLAFRGERPWWDSN